MKNPTDYMTLEAQVSFLNYMVALFCQPEDDSNYYKNLLDNLSGACQVLSPESIQLVDEMKNYAKEVSHEEMLVSYTKIFLGPFKAIAHPYSSVYLGDGSLNGASTVWVKKFYNLSGFNFNESLKDLPDHVAVELEFLYNLKFSELENIRENNHKEAGKLQDRYNEFFNNHFKVWIPLFCNKVIVNGNNVFYSNLCNLLLGFIKLPDRIGS